MKIYYYYENHVKNLKINRKLLYCNKSSKFLKRLKINGATRIQEKRGEILELYLFILAKEEIIQEFFFFFLSRPFTYV